MRPIRQSELLIGVGLLFAAFVVNVTLAYRSIIDLHDDAVEVTRSHGVSGALNALFSALQDAETGQRGYLITGEEKYLKPYQDASAVIDKRIERVDELTKDDRQQHDHAVQLSQAVADKRAELARTIALRKTDLEAARQEVMTDKGKNAMDAIREVVDQMQSREKERLLDREQAHDESFRWAIRGVVLAAALGIMAIAGFLWLLRRHLMSQNKAVSEIYNQRELLRATLASIGDGVITTDHNCHVTYLNAIAEGLTGWPLADAAGRHLDEVFHIINEKTRQPVENPCTKVFREGAVVGLANHTLLVGRDGRELPIDDSAAPIKDDRGQLFGTVLVFREATEKRAGAEARERLAAIVESSSDAIIGEDPDGIITTWNTSAEQLFGYAASEAIGKSIRFIVPPEFREQFTNMMEKIRHGEKAEYIDTVRLRKDGRRIEVSSHISPVRNAEGEVIGAAKVAHDISERKRSERVLRFLSDASAELAMLVDYPSTMQRIARLAVPFLADWCIVDMIDAQGRIERVAHAHANPNREPLLKAYVEHFPLSLNSSALSAQVLRSAQPELLTEMPAALIEKLITDEQQRELLVQLDPRSAVSVPIMIRNVAVGSLNFVASESGRRYSPADMELAVELARRAAVAVENAQLYQDLKEAQRQKDDFLAMLAHELRNPISAIQYANELGRVGGANHRDTSELIERQVQNLLHLIDDLLDVSRITRDKIDLRREFIDGATVLQRAVATAEPLIKSRKHSLVVEMPNEPLPLYVDLTRVEQILVNLLTNAAKYTPEEGQITARAAAADGIAIFTVKDTGLGIPESMLPRIFDLFTQVDPSLDRSQGGLGIGLTVVRKLVELHGGSVSATSEGLGRGSEFTVRLPLATPPTDSDGQPMHESAAVRRQKLLVVDDNVQLAQSLASLLSRAGHNVQIAHDGFAAIKAARSFRPDVILLDLGLPGIDGYKVAETLRADRSFRRTRLIAVSGYGQPQDRKRSAQVGFDHHLVKPVDLKTLSAAISGGQSDE